MEDAPLNVPSNGKRRGSLKGLFGFKGEPVHLCMPPSIACQNYSRIMLLQMSSAFLQSRQVPGGGLIQGLGSREAFHGRSPELPGEHPCQISRWDLHTDRLKHYADKSKKDKQAQLVASQPLPGTTLQPAGPPPPAPAPPLPQKKSKQSTPKKGIFQVA